MGRTKDQIADGIITGIRENDETVRTSYGPVRDTVIDPVAGALEPYEAAAEYLLLAASTTIVDNATPDMALALASRHGVGRSIGSYSYGSQTFYRYAKPSAGVSYSPPVGQLIRRRDGKMFQVKTHTVTLTSENAAASYNAARRRYEVQVPIQAISVGPEYDSAPGLITELDGTVHGFDGTVNLEWIANGRRAKTPAATVEEARLAMLGSAAGTHGGLNKAVILSGIRTDDVAIVRHSEPVFQRAQTGRPAIDIHVVGENSVEYTYTTVASAGQTTFVLPRQPALAVSKVLRNGGAVSATLLRDSARSTAFSSQALDSVVVSACADGDVLAITYTYNAVVHDLQTQLFSETEITAMSTGLFSVSSVVRGPVRVPIEVSIFIAIGQQRRLAGIESATAAVRSVCTPGVMGLTIMPNDLQQAVKAAVYGSTAVVVRTLRRKDIGSSDVGIVELNRNEVAYFADSADLEVSDV